VQTNVCDKGGNVYFVVLCEGIMSQLGVVALADMQPDGSLQYLTLKAFKTKYAKHFKTVKELICSSEYIKLESV
jgi:hypothetical protein